MRCPFCGHDDTQVKDSRPTDDNSSIRRRRNCTACMARFTTFERVELRDITVLKNDGRREPFDREKILRSMQLALRKRPVEPEKIERVVNSIVRQIEASGEAEISTRQVGEFVMQAMADLDPVGYVRYASVYKDFHQVSDFSRFLVDLDKKRKSA